MYPLMTLHITQPAVLITVRHIMVDKTFTSRHPITRDTAAEAGIGITHPIQVELLSS